jgi:benzoyl-CoA reductase subunit D
MLLCGIDGGAKNTKAVLVDEVKVLAKSLTPTGFNQKESAKKVFENVIKEAGVKKEEVRMIVATGEGQKEIDIAHKTITVVTADTLAVTHLYKGVHTIIDVGAEEGRAIKCSDEGKVIDFAINEKCAAGAGTFCETMARTIEVPLEEMGEISLRSTTSIPMNAQCAVFAESEVVSLIHAKTPKEDIARAIHEAIADRIASMVRRVGIEEKVVLMGGLSKNIGFVEALKKELGVEFIIPEDPEFMTAYGAGLSGKEGK